MRFAADTWLWLLPLPPALWFLLRWSDGRVRGRLDRALGARAGEHVEGRPTTARQWQRFFLLTGMCWLIVALARPQWGANEIEVRQRGTDVVIALDISNSMRAQDIVPDRLSRARGEFDDFLDGYDQGRVGLVLFAGKAFVQCPLTLDRGTAKLFLDMADTDMISTQGTAIGDALTTSMKLLLDGRGDHAGDARQAIILVTDGEDLEGGWKEAAEKCRDQGIAIIPVGVGKESGGLVPDPEGGYMKDESGNVVMSRLDLASLQEMADMGPGVVFRIGGGGFDQAALRDVISRLGERELEGRHISQLQERFPWPLGLALASLWLGFLVRPRRRHALAAAVLLALMTVSSGAGALPWETPGTSETRRGVDLYESGSYDDALRCFESARAKSPDDPRLSLAIGETLARLDRREEATREFQRALSLTSDPRLRSTGYYDAGTNALANGDLKQAVDQLRRSLDIDPEQRDARHNLEYAVRQLEQRQQQKQQQKQDKSGDKQQGDQQQQDQGDQQQQQGDRQQQRQGDQQQQQQADQQRQQDQQQQGDQQRQQQGSEQQQQEQQQRSDARKQQQSAQNPDSTRTDQASPEQAAADSLSAEQLDRERALSILKGLDRDEEELRKSVQKRLQGKGNRSGKRW